MDPQHNITRKLQIVGALGLSFTAPPPAGAALIDGGNVYAYGLHAGFKRLASFTSGRTFRRDFDTDCP